jgi:hypothetical protein
MPRHCIDPKVGRLWRDCVDGKLMKRGREKDAKSFGEHVRRCGSCKRVLIEHAHREVAIPTIKSILRHHHRHVKNSAR